MSKLVRLNINTSLSYEKILHENFPYVFDFKILKLSSLEDIEAEPTEDEIRKQIFLPKVSIKDLENIDE